METPEGLPHQEEIARTELLKMKRLHTTEITQDTGAKFAVDYAHIPLTETPTARRVVSIYMAGMPQDAIQAPGQHPQEVPFSAELLKGTATDFVLLKAEGLNSKAFKDTDGKITDSLTIDVAWQQLQEICKAQGIDISDPLVTFHITGFSEGAAQGAGLIEKVLDAGGNVGSFTVIDGAGVVGYKDPNEALIIPQNTLRIPHNQNREPQKQPVTKTPWGLHLSKELLNSYHSLLDGPVPNEVGPDDPKIDHTYVERLKGLIPFVSGPPRAIVPERMKLAWSRSETYGRVLARGVATIIFAGSQSEIHDIDDVVKQVTEWQNTPGTDVTLVTSDTKHFDAHLTSAGVGFAAALANPHKEKRNE